MKCLASLIGVLILATGCTHPAGERTPPHPSPPSPTSTGAPTSSAQPPLPQPPRRPGPPPGADATPAAVADWIAAGRPADPADFRTVERDGQSTGLKPDEVAFRLPGTLKPNALAGCVRRYTPALSCLPALRNPPPRPEQPTGEWIDSWVDFDGLTITVGSYHGDPGPFNDGPGQPLAYGDSLKFGDYQCRSDPTGLYCVSLSHHTGLRLSDTVAAFGCVQQAAPPPGIGEQFNCG